MPEASPDTQAIHRLLKKVRRIEIHSRRLVSDAMSGAYHSLFKGQGIDFEQVREYLPGDDVRNIDWNITAKMGRPFVKEFREERERTLLLAIDLSGSGDYGSDEHSKRDLAAEIAAVLAFSAVQNNDKVGLLLFTDTVERFIPPARGRKHSLRLIREILFYRPEQQRTDIPCALEYMNQVVRRRSITVVLSDFLVDESQAEERLFTALSMAQRRHELICLHLTDPRENELPVSGLMVLEDAETGEQIEIDAGDPQLRRSYQSYNTERHEQFQKQLRKRGIDYLEIETDRPYLNTLRTFFMQRSRQR